MKKGDGMNGLRQRLFDSLFLFSYSLNIVIMEIMVISIITLYIEYSNQFTLINYVSLIYNLNTSKLDSEKEKTSSYKVVLPGLNWKYFG